VLCENREVGLADRQIAQSARLGADDFGASFIPRQARPMRQHGTSHATLGGRRAMLAWRWDWGGVIGT
jgi:hypothetical protein